ncbi:MAG: methyltransferase, partial [Bacteroidetes bacterium]|nr:methyltransferase [Bacteroidota bacterium]
YLENSEEYFDLIFVDADKENYINYFEKLKPRLSPGAIVMFDNVLWYGKVLQDNPKQKSTQVIKELNEKIAQDTDFESLILPLRDGVHLLLKK